MCDKGILEYRPDSIKLEYCIEIKAELWKEMVEKISQLIEQPVVISSAKPGEYPTDRDSHNRNTIVIDLENTTENHFLREVVRFSLKELPGCCGILVSYSVRVAKRFQNKGINSYLQGVREKIAKHNGYTTLMCTTTDDNKAEIHILETHGWDKVHSFKNRRTGNTVLTYMKVLD